MMRRKLFKQVWSFTRYLRAKATSLNDWARTNYAKALD